VSDWQSVQVFNSYAPFGSESMLNERYWVHDGALQCIQFFLPNQNKWLNGPKFEHLREDYAHGVRRGKLYVLVAIPMVSIWHLAWF